MKEIIISSDGDSMVYLVPDEVADNLRDHCIFFCDKWMKTSPNDRKYKINGVWCFSEKDFIDYLNNVAFPDKKSVFVRNLGWTDLVNNLPKEYRNHPYFNF